MISITSLRNQSRLDLRASLFTGLRRGIKFKWFEKITLIALDATVLFLAWQGAQTYSNSLDSVWNLQHSSISLLSLIAVDMILISINGLYAFRQKHLQYLTLIKSITLSRLLLLLFAFIYQQSALIPGPLFISSWAFSALFICLSRFTVAETIAYYYKQGAIYSPIFLICAPEDRQKATNLLARENHYKVLGWADVNSVAIDRYGLDSTLEHISRLSVAEVFVCSWERLQNRMFLYWKLRNLGITLHILPIDLKTSDQNLQLKMLGGTPIMRLSPPLIIGSDFVLKRVFDFCFATILVLVASPIYLCIAFLIKLDSSGPIFYRQTRIGLHGKEFKIWKFRTMFVNAEQIQKDLETRNEMKDGILFKIKNDPRITHCGNFLRRYSLDELPQLFNVIAGDMSLVGPRPLPIRDVEKFSNHHFIRHEVLPGITGLWQVSGRSNITNFEDVIHLDTTYIENWSLSLDWQILLQTIGVVMGKRGAY